MSKTSTPKKLILQATKCLYKLLGQESSFSLSGGDTSSVGDDDATDDGANDDYVADITTAHEAWDPGPTQN